jgi:hypothetical protein
VAEIISKLIIKVRMSKYYNPNVNDLFIFYRNIVPGKSLGIRLVLSVHVAIKEQLVDY